MTTRRTRMKTCSRCQVNPPHRKGASYCTPCASEYSREWYKRNPDKVYKAYSETRRAATAKWMATHKEEWNAYQRAYRLKQKIKKEQQALKEST